MTGSRIALVAEDQRQANAIQTHLKKATGQSAFLCKIEDIREHLGRDTDGLLLLTASNPTDAEAVLRLIQEIVLQKLSTKVLTILDESCPDRPDFHTLDRFGVECLRWGDACHRLPMVVKEHTVRAQSFLGTCQESLEDIISRRLLSQTPSLLPMVERIALAAAHDVTVLFTGETGTGKTFLARLMHDCSVRKNNPFLVVPCGAQPANLVESAFFGHVKGAFTGADRSKLGKFAAAGDGTILLDEIDTLGLEQQAGLLRVIETGEYEPVGSNETHICTARIVVASNWNLEEAAERGKFRRDLYYRLNVMSFHLPPLRERIQDIDPLVRGMAARFNTKFRKDLFEISPEAMAALETFPWPGNIRQLENAIQQSVLVSSGPELLLEHLPQPIREYKSVVTTSPTNGNGHMRDDSLSHNLDVVERNVIQRALEKYGNSRARAASALGISRVTLYKKMKKYGLMGTGALPTSSSP